MTYRERMADGTVRITGGPTVAAPGTPSPSPAPVVFTFLTPSRIWNCPHGLNTSFPDYTVYVNGQAALAGGFAEDANNFVVTFANPTAGTVRISK